MTPEEANIIDTATKVMTDASSVIDQLCAKLKQLEQQKILCEWISIPGNHNEWWLTSCGKHPRAQLEFLEKEYSFCPYCGGALITKPISPE